MSYRFEIAVDSLESALTAQAYGADRIELCADLGIGGITPSHGAIHQAIAKLQIPVHVIIRPRRGDFLYTENEFEAMRQDIDMVKAAGAAGVVFGILRADGSLDAERIQELVALARPMTVTFHRAFDMCRAPFTTLDQLIDLHIDTLLTSGQEATAEAGLRLIAELVQRAGDQICIMPGGGIHAGNIQRIANVSGAREFHFSGSATMAGPMTFKNPRLSLRDDVSEYQRRYASAERIRKTISALS